MNTDRVVAARSQRGERTGPQEVSYQWLKRWIATLPRDVGVFITEAEVMEAANTGRTPAREALLRMQTEGLLEIVPRKGAFVPPVSDGEIEAVMQARVLIEEWCVRQVASNWPEMAKDLENLLVDQEEFLDDPTEFISRDRIFHRTIVLAANGILGDFYDILRQRQLRMGLLALSATADRRQRVTAEHRAIVAAIRDGDADAAAAATGAHLANTLSALRVRSPHAGSGTRKILPSAR